LSKTTDTFYGKGGDTKRMGVASHFLSSALFLPFYFLGLIGVIKPTFEHTSGGYGEFFTRDLSKKNK